LGSAEIVGTGTAVYSTTGERDEKTVVVIGEAMEGIEGKEEGDVENAALGGFKELLFFIIFDPNEISLVYCQLATNTKHSTQILIVYS
jgi:hypothetical protein